MDFTKTLVITDYKVVRPNLARVVISTTGQLTRSEVAELINKKLGYLAAAVENSFRSLSKGAAVGFVRANRSIRELDDAALKRGDVTARYTVMSSNMLMDKQDRTLWEVKSGPAGKYIARHGHEDLSELVEASVDRTVSGTPKLSRITMARAARHEFAAFCTNTGSMDYGFVLQAGDSHCEVFSASTSRQTVVANEMMVALQPVTIDPTMHREVMARVQTEEERATAAAYWKTLFSYAPEYADQLVKFVNESAVV